LFRVCLGTRGEERERKKREREKKGRIVHKDRQETGGGGGKKGGLGDQGARRRVCQQGLLFVDPLLGGERGAKGRGKKKRRRGEDPRVTETRRQHGKCCWAYVSGRLSLWGRQKGGKKKKEKKKKKREAPIVRRMSDSSSIVSPSCCSFILNLFRGHRREGKGGGGKKKKKREGIPRRRGGYPSKFSDRAPIRLYSSILVLAVR